MHWVGERGIVVTANLLLGGRGAWLSFLAGGDGGITLLSAVTARVVVVPAVGRGT